MNFVFNLFKDEGFLYLLRIVLVVFGIGVSVGFFLPKGVESYQKWKEKKERKDLSSAINNICAGLFILFYLLGAFFIDLVRG